MIFIVRFFPLIWTLFVGWVDTVDIYTDYSKKLCSIIANDSVSVTLYHNKSRSDGFFFTLNPGSELTKNMKKFFSSVTVKRVSHLSRMGLTLNDLKVSFSTTLIGEPVSTGEETSLTWIITVVDGPSLRIVGCFHVD